MKPKFLWNSSNIFCREYYHHVYYFKWLEPNTLDHIEEAKQETDERPLAKPWYEDFFYKNDYV